MLKRIVSLLLTTSIVATSMIGVSLAAHSSEQEQIVGEYYSILENKTVQGQTIRVMQPTPSSLSGFSALTSDHSKPLSIDNTQNMLIAMGRNKTSVSLLSEDEISEYANATRVCSITSYERIDSNGNRTIVTEAEALAAVASVEGDQIIGEELPDNSYIYLYHEILCVNNSTGDIKFTTEAEWLTMPATRGTDALGSCAQSTVITPDSIGGLYWYTKEYYDVYGNVIEEETPAQTAQTIAEDSFQTVTNNSFYGVGATFTLPADHIPATNYHETYTYSDFFVSVHYRAHIRNPNRPIQFSSVGTYSHKTLSIIQASPLDITSSSNYPAEVSFPSSILQTKYSVQISAFSYVPA